MTEGQQPSAAPPPSLQDEDGPSGRRWGIRGRPGTVPSWRRRLLVVSLWSLAMIGLGAAAAFEGFNRWVVPTEPAINLTIAPVTIDPSSSTDVAPMPDVVGLTTDEALADIGLDPGAVAIEERAWVGEGGRVVGQQPVRGTSDPGDVLLAVAEAASTPDIVGRNLADAISALEAIGVRAQVVEVAAPGVEPGTVVASEPSAGEPAATDTVIDVAARLSALYLDALRPLEGSCRDASAEVAGRVLERSVVCELRPRRNEVSVSYQLNGDVERFEAVVGQSDRTDLGATVALRIDVDGEEVVRRQFGFGEIEEVTVPVEGALRLTITSLLADDGETEDGSVGQVDVVLGNARLVGAEPALDRLTELR